MVNDLEPFQIVRVIGGTNVRDVVERGLRCIVQPSGHIGDPPGSHAGHDFLTFGIRLDGEHRVGKGLH